MQELEQNDLFPTPDVVENPDYGVAQVMEARKQAVAAETRCKRTATAALELERILKGLLDSSILLCRVERLYLEGEAGPRAVCHIGGQLQELRIHPDVSIAELQSLNSWEFAAVNPKEMVIVGAVRDPEFHVLAQGAVVEFRSYHDEARGLVRVRRRGEDEAVVTLSPSLRAKKLTPGASLVLQRGDERFAIDLAQAETGQSTFEMPIEQIQTRLSDLAGLDKVLEIFVEDILLWADGEIRDQFTLKPLRGVVLYSFMPGMGKTASLRGLVWWLHELGKEKGFDVALHVVKPNSLKNMFHGEDARNVRELCRAIRARQNSPRTRPLYQIVVLDEVESLGKRAGGDDGAGYTSAAQNDIVQSLLVELDGLEQECQNGDNPPGHVLWVGLTNRLDLLDDALKLPGRFCDRVEEMPAPNMEMAEGVLSVHARGKVPWYLDGKVQSGLPETAILSRILRPALARIFGETVLRYSTDGRQSLPVTAGQIISNAHYAESVNAAKRSAATRCRLGVGIPAVCFDDVLASLLEKARSCAEQMAADRQMLARQLRIGVRVARVDLVPRDELDVHRFLRESPEEHQLA